jgi:hypothetical protein
MELPWTELDGGLRLVAALFTVVGIQGFGPGEPASRVAAQIVTGIGFLGTGTIIVLRGHVLGLTTAASICPAAAFGMAFGSGLWLLAVAESILIIIVLRLTGLEDAARDNDTDGPGTRGAHEAHLTGAPADGPAGVTVSDVRAGAWAESRASSGPSRSRGREARYQKPSSPGARSRGDRAAYVFRSGA